MDRLLNLTVHAIGELFRSDEFDEKELVISNKMFEVILDFLVDRDDVQLTVDDGNITDMSIILPELLKRGVKAKFFVAVGKIGQRGYLSERDLTTLETYGMELGSHGVAHIDWRKLESCRLCDEVQGSKERLEQIIGKPITIASCPFGSYDRRVLRFLREAGYHKVFTSDRGWSRSEAWLQPRNSLHAWDNRKSIQKLLSKSYFAPDFIAQKFKTILKQLR